MLKRLSALALSAHFFSQPQSPSSAENDNISFLAGVPRTCERASLMDFSVSVALMYRWVMN